MNNEFDILIVEDEKVVVDAIKKTLIPEGFTVDGSIDLESAADKLQQNKYKLILLDIMLPNISGFKLLEIAKKKYPKTPVVILTGYATLSNIIQSFKMGAFDYIPKPFAFEELLSVVHRAVRLNEMRASMVYEDTTQRLRKQGHTDNMNDRYFFLGEHSWVYLSRNDTVKVGVGGTFPNIIGTIQKISLPSVNEEIKQGNGCAKIITRENLTHNIWAPLSGKVIENNPEIVNNSNLIHTDPFCGGWLIRVIPTNLEMELVNLLPC